MGEYGEVGNCSMHEVYCPPYLRSAWSNNIGLTYNNRRKPVTIFPRQIMMGNLVISLKTRHWISLKDPSPWAWTKKRGFLMGVVGWDAWVNPLTMRSCWAVCITGQPHFPLLIIGICAFRNPFLLPLGSAATVQMGRSRKSTGVCMEIMQIDCQEPLATVSFLGISSFPHSLPDSKGHGCPKYSVLLAFSIIMPSTSRENLGPALKLPASQSLICKGEWQFFLCSFTRQVWGSLRKRIRKSCDRISQVQVRITPPALPLEMAPRARCPGWHTGPGPGLAGRRRSCWYQDDTKEPVLLFAAWLLLGQKFHPLRLPPADYSCHSFCLLNLPVKFGHKFLPRTYYPGFSILPRASEAPCALGRRPWICMPHRL